MWDNFLVDYIAGTGAGNTYEFQIWGAQTRNRENHQIYMAYMYKYEV